MQHIKYKNELQKKIFEFIYENDNCIGVKLDDIYSNIHEPNCNIQNELDELEKKRLITNFEYEDISIYNITLLGLLS